MKKTSSQQTNTLQKSPTHTWKKRKICCCCNLSTYKQVVKLTKPYSDNVWNALNPLPEDVICEKKRVLKRRLFFRHIQKTIVGNDNKSVHWTSQLLYCLQCLHPSNPELPYLTLEGPGMCLYKRTTPTKYLITESILAQPVKKRKFK